MSVTMTRAGDVFVLDLGSGENRFHPDWIAGFDEALDEVVKADGPRALVTTAQGKIWSNGLDLDWVGQNLDRFVPYVASAQRLLARMLELPVPSVAALQGHAFAAGAMLALAHDVRVMRADRGYFCLPEVDIHIPFSPGMSAMIQARLEPRVAHEAMTTGRRYGGQDALVAGVVDAVADEGAVLDAAVGRARALAGKASPTLGLIKSRMYARALSLLRDESTLTQEPGTI